MVDSTNAIDDSAANAMPSRRRGLVLAGACLAGGLAISVLLFATGPVAEPETVEQPVWPVTTLRVTPGIEQQRQLVFGAVTARAEATLASEVQGKIEAILVREGDRVAAGTRVLTVDPVEQQYESAKRQAEVQRRSADLEAARAELVFLRSQRTDQAARLAAANAKLERHEQLRERRLISQGLLDDVRAQTADVRIDVQSHEQKLTQAPLRVRAAEADLAVAQAAASQAQLRLDKLALTAPFDAVVLSVDVAPGAQVPPGQALLTLADVTSYEVRLPVAPSAMPAYQRAAQQQRAGESILPIKATSDLGYRFTFDRLASRVRPGQSQVNAIFRFDAADSTALPALASTQQLIVSLPPVSNAVAVPESAIYDGERIYVVEENVLAVVPIERLGEQIHPATGERLLLVRSASLEDGARVVTTRLPRPLPGLPVRDLSAGESSRVLVQQPEMDSPIVTGQTIVPARLPVPATQSVVPATAMQHRDNRRTMAPTQTPTQAPKKQTKASVPTSRSAYGMI
ncbi:MAG: biotin/lipoyl-binding protein [Pseudomonadota bacterium]